MTNKDILAKVEIEIQASVDHVWEALVNPDLISKYMFGTIVESDWTPGSVIYWKGEWKGKKYEDKGQIIRIEPSSLLQYSHFSPLSGQEDKPENYHRVTIQLENAGNATHVVLTQDHNPTKEAQAHSEQNWSNMLSGLKKVVEENS